MTRASARKPKPDGVAEMLDWEHASPEYAFAATAERIPVKAAGRLRVGIAPKLTPKLSIAATGSGGSPRLVAF